jgi:hypothetical protein
VARVSLSPTGSFYASAATGGRIPERDFAAVELVSRGRRGAGALIHRRLGCRTFLSPWRRSRQRRSSGEWCLLLPVPALDSGCFGRRFGARTAGEILASGWPCSSSSCFCTWC